MSTDYRCLNCGRVCAWLWTAPKAWYCHHCKTEYPPRPEDLGALADGPDHWVQVEYRPRVGRDKRRLTTDEMLAWGEAAKGRELL